MTLFHYQAVDVRGTRQSGEIEGQDRSAVLEMLHRQGLVPVAVHEGKPQAKSMSVFEPLWSRPLAKAKGRLTGKELLSLTQSLAALLKAGLTIDRALAITANLNKRTSVRESMLDLGKRVRSGSSFADALGGSAIALPPYYIGMVQAGEIGGNLPQTLARLGELLRRQQEIRERVRSALVYPGILAGVVVVTVILLLTFVLPRFGALFAESGAPLPWSTRTVLALGEFVAAYWWLLLLGAAGLITGAGWFFRSVRGRERIDDWLLRSPVVLGLPAAIDTARLLRTLSTLLSNGVPLATAMRIGRATLANLKLRAALDEAAKRIKAGESISGALAQTGVFPAHAIHLARVGEETGRLEDLLLEAAAILEGESHGSLERLLTLLVPLLTISMGLIVAALIGSVLIGLLSINDLAF